MSGRVARVAVLLVVGGATLAGLTAAARSVGSVPTASAGAPASTSGPATPGASLPPGVTYAGLVAGAAAALEGGDVAAAGDALARARRLAPGSPLLAQVADELERGGVEARRDALRRLQAAAGALALPETARPGDVAEARRRLQEIDARPGLRDLATPGGRGSPVDALVAAARRGVGAAVAALGGTGAAAVAAVVLGLLVGLAVGALRSATAPRPLSRGTDVVGDDADADAEWRLASEAAARGDYREAVRRAFRSALVALAVGGRLRVEAATTGGELLAGAAADPALAAVLAPAVAGFDRAWYGPGPVGRDEWERARRCCAEVRRLARGRFRPRGVR